MVALFGLRRMAPGKKLARVNSEDNVFITKRFP
jgi:hypothetical protein